MRPSLRLLGLLALVQILAIVPVASQTEEPGGGDPRAVETTRDRVSRYTDSAIRGQKEAPSGDAGGGVTWVDFLRRIMTSVEGVQFDETDNGLRFTWNATNQVAAILDFVTDPTLYGPAKDAAQGDSNLLGALNDQVGAGDDWTTTVRYIPGFVKKKKIYGRSMAFKKLRSGLNALTDWIRPDCEPEPEWRDDHSRAKPEEVQQWTRNAVRAITAVPEFEIDLFYRQRGDFVGPDEWGGSAQYTWARGSVNNNKTREALWTEKQRIFDGGRVIPDQRRLRVVSQEQRITAKIDFRERKEYELTQLVPTPVYRERNRTLVGTAAWSLRFPNDNKEDPSRTPRYELQASYENIDNDPERQSRAIVRAIFTRRVRFLGDTTEITAGILWSNRPEYVAKESSDAQLGANVALSFNFGETGGGS